jgi:hypothetical protein
LITNLPEPHQAVSVSFKWPSETICIVEYIGPSLEALRDAGCITDEILGVFTRVKMRVFHRNGSVCKRSRWYGEYGKRSPYWKITWSVRREFALTLPGVTTEQHAQAGGWEPSPLSTEAEPAMVQRARCIGRKQRPVRWSVFERKLIVVDWERIQAQTIVTREGGRV